MVITRAARVVAVLAAAAVSGFGAAAPAAADPPGHVRVAVTTASSSADKSVTVNCPPGTVVTGGGGYLTAPSTTVQGDIAIDRLEPHDDGSGFTTTLREARSTPDLWRMTGEALCATPPAGWDVVSVTGPLSASVVSAGCGDKTLIGVGGRINNGGGDVVLDHVVPSSTLKSVTVRGTLIPGRNRTTWSVTAFAVCANTTAQLVMWSAPVSVDPSKSLNTSCANGRALYSVGASITPGSGLVYLDVVHAVDADTMAARANKATGAAPPAWGLMGYGICG
ncbi:hypothetical protein [Saccharothrix sp. HUAS TT1]|uniref:hypothetical protein n=1 Tax=unclassified Saccharothrix TaxID=2593673 RepID=UPI00345BE9A5